MEEIDRFTRVLRSSLAESLDYILKNPIFGCRAYPRNDDAVDEKAVFTCRRFENAEPDKDDLEDGINNCVLAMRAAGVAPGTIELIGFKERDGAIIVTLVGEGAKYHQSRTRENVRGWGEWDKDERPDVYAAAPKGNQKFEPKSEVFKNWAELYAKKSLGGGH
jgi:hypothetical protein